MTQQPISCGADGTYETFLVPQPGNAYVGSVATGITPAPTNAEAQLSINGISIVPGSDSITVALALTTRVCYDYLNLAGPLTDITAQPPIGVAAPIISAVPSVSRTELGVGERGQFCIDLETSDVTSATRFLVTFELTTAEGASDVFTLLLAAVPPSVNFVSSPGSIRMASVRGNQSLAEFTLRNSGTKDATNVEFLLPGIVGLSIASPASGRVNVLRRGQSVSVVLQFRPSETQEIGQQQGGMVARATEFSSGITIRLTVTTVSQLIGGLNVYVEDGLWSLTLEARV